MLLIHVPFYGFPTQCKHLAHANTSQQARDPRKHCNSIIFEQSGSASCFWKQQMSGYNYNFVDDLPDRLLCQICQLPCRDPQRSESCVHVFCKSELNSNAYPNEGISCPKCNQTGFSTFPDKALGREIKELKVYCPNKKDGCGWTGELLRVDDHLNKCEIACSKCKQMVHFTTMSRHLDEDCPCYCPYCDSTADREVISSKHKEKCHKFPLTCPNNCGVDNIPQGDMDEHKKVCPLEMVQCEYGCGARITRNEVTEHDRANLLTHVRAFKHELESSSQNAKDLVNHCDEAERNIATLLSDVTKELDNFDDKLKFKVDHIDMDVITPLTAEMHRSCDSSEGFKKHCAPTSWYCVIPAFLLVLSWLSIIHYVVLLVILERNKNDFINPVLTDMDERLSLSLSELMGSGCFIERPPPNSSLEYQLEYWRKVFGIISTEVILEMRDFDRYRNSKQSWYSTPFFPFEGGYVMCLRVDAAGYGEGEGTHISVFLYLMKGPHDDELEWPMQGKYAVVLIDPSNFTCKPYTKYVHFENHQYNRVTNRKMSSTGLGYPKYIEMYNAGNATNVTTATSFLTKRNSLLFMISYYKYKPVL